MTPRHLDKRSPFLGAVVLARDEELMLPGALASLGFADEVLVAIDDRTIDSSARIAHENGARTQLFSFRDFSSARAEALALLSEDVDWVLLIDADERVTAALAREIRQRIEGASNDEDRFAIPIRNFFYGQEMRHGGWTREAPTRLFRKGKISFGGLVHEHPDEFGTPSQTLRVLGNPLVHFSHRSVEESLRKDWLYADLGARDRFERNGRSGASVTARTMLVRAATLLLRRQVIETAWMDGPAGVLESFRRVTGELSMMMRLKELQTGFDERASYARLDTSLELARRRPRPRPSPATSASKRRDRVSICLCVHDGASFLGEQLESLAQQSQVPDELVVVDDASRDESVGLIESFARHAPFPVRIIRHEVQAGLTVSYDEAITAANGEILMPCDQDDIWLAHKVGRQANWLGDRPHAAGVFSDSQLVDERGSDLPTTLWTEVGFDDNDRAQLTSGDCLPVLLRHLGGFAAHALAFRADRVAQITPSAGGLTHDAWTAGVLATSGGLWGLDECLVKYRQHATNLVGGTRHRSLRARADGSLARMRAREAVQGLEKLLESLDARGSSTWGDLSRRERMLVEARIEEIRLRASLPDERVDRVPILLRALRNGIYPRSTHGARMALADLLRSPAVR